MKQLAFWYHSLSYVFQLWIVIKRAKIEYDSENGSKGTDKDLLSCLELPFKPQTLNQQQKEAKASFPD